MRLFIWICGLLIFQVANGAEEKQGSTPLETRRQVRFLTVGDMPPFRQVIENGVRRELPPPSGSVPPRQASVRLQKADEELTLGVVELKLGRLSSALALPTGQGRLLVGESGWVGVEIPEEGDVLVVIWRNQDAKTWNSVRSIAVGEDPRPGLTRVTNLARGSLAIIQGEEKILLPIGKPWLKRLAPGSPVPFQVGVPMGSGYRRVTSMSLEQRADERSMVFLYHADGQSPRQPIKVLVLRERTGI